MAVQRQAQDCVGLLLLLLLLHAAWFVAAAGIVCALSIGY